MERRFLVMSVLLVLSAGPVSAQLSSDDMAALKEQARAKGWTFTIGETPATAQPTEALCGLVVPEDWKERAPFTRFEAKDGLPAAFDWRALGGCTPIKNQGGCGSCWAFATVGTFECAIRIKDGIMVNLAEQWLVSCNQETETPHVLGKGVWGCGGGWWGHDYHAGLKTDPCGGTGAVLTAYCPYYGNVLQCGCPYPHDYAMDSWGYIAGEEAIPEVGAIKQAIFEYGPACVALYVNDAFKAYRGGVFNAHENKEVNHGVVLVGWDDTQGASGVWILRNSWSDVWGEGGYMRIEYGCSNVGFGASYVVYAGRGQGIGPTITRQPRDGTAPNGWFQSFGVAATGVGDLHYQWQHDGHDIGGDTPTLIVERVTASDEGTYACRVSDARGIALSNGAELRIDETQAVPLADMPALVLLATLCILVGIVALWRPTPRSCTGRLKRVKVW